LATATIAHEPSTLTVEALRAIWATPNPQEIPATPHGLILLDLSASGNEPEDDEAEKYIKQHAIIAHNQTSGPGVWLSEGLVDSLRSDQSPLDLTQAERGQYERLRIAQESFRGFRHDGQHVIADESANTFNSLSKAPDKDRGRFSWQPEPKPKKKAKGNEEKKVAAFTPTTDRQMDDAYSAWASDPSPEYRERFYEALHGFVQTRFKQSKVAGQLTKADEIEDATSDFMIEIMGTLQRMTDRREQLRQPCCHYVTAAMGLFRKGAVIDLAERKAMFDYDSDVAFGKGEDEQGTNSAADVAWLGGRKDSEDWGLEDSVSDVVDMAIEEMLEPDRGMYEDRRAGRTQVEIGRKYGMTQPAVSQRFTKGDRALKGKAM